MTAAESGSHSGSASAGGRWSDPADSVPDPVDDGIAVGVPPAPTEDEPVDGLSGEEAMRFGGTAAGGVAEPEVFPEPDLAAERDEYLHALQRLQADFENYRKRVQRQQDEQSARAASDLVTKLLPVLDTLDLARAHLGQNGTPAATEPAGPAESEEGRALEQARAQLLDVLGREGLERVDEAGVAFDPVVHDAVAHAEALATDDAGAVTVDEILRAGYRWRGQVLRPAMVRVRG
jgi:molecular chaperone GrpE